MSLNDAAMIHQNQESFEKWLANHMFVFSPVCTGCKAGTGCNEGCCYLCGSAAELHGPNQFTLKTIEANLKVEDKAME